ncbi:MAG: STAS domain-containing protein [Phycisphaerales bacterium]
MPPEAMEVHVEEQAAGIILVPEGDVDLHRSPALRERLKRVAQQKPRRLIVDLSHVPYMDSSGVATLVEAMQITRRQSTTLVLCGMQDRVRSIFEIAKLNSVFKIVPDRDAALNA